MRIVWITMLAIAERDGLVESSLPGLADLARVTVDECQEALVVLAGPDDFSRSKEFEGRRIQEVESGWMILNYEKYRNRLSCADRREYQRVKQVEYRKRRKVVKDAAVKEGAGEAIADGFKEQAAAVVEDDTPTFPEDDAA